jgi:hypothetical protein
MEATLEEWSGPDGWRIGLPNSHWEERGRGKGKYVLARHDDLGSYKVGNWSIITYEENSRIAGERMLGKPKSQAHRENLSTAWETRPPCSTETRVKMSESHTGNPKCWDTRRERYGPSGRP